MSKTVVQVAPRYLPDRGGVETHAAAVNQELLKRGWHVQVICLQTNQKKPLHQKGEVEILRIPANKTRGLKHKILIWRWMYEHKDLFTSASIVQVHDVFWWLFPVLKTVFGKVYTTFHGWEGVYPVPWQNKLHRWVVARLSKKTVHVGSWIQEFYWDKPDAITYGGADSKKVQTDVKKPSKNPTFVFLGRLEPENNIDQYLDLIAELRKTYSDLKMIWVGGGQLTARCQQVGTVTGMVDDPQKWIQKADIVFANSYLAITEAQAQGKVVCAFYDHQLKQRYLETFPSRENLILSNNILRMNEKIINILNNNKLYREMAKTARKSAEQMTWKKVTEMYLKLWQ